MASRPKKQKITMDVVPIDEEEEDESDDEDDGEAGDNLFKVPTLKRKLLADFSRPSVASSLFAADSMKVFLRIRPFTKQEIDTHEDQGCLTVESDTTVSTHAPKDSNQSRNSKHTQTKTNMKYSFSQIFNENTTQKSFFNSTMLGMVKEFIEGQNCLVFTYGVTSSGKTYTIQGNPKDAGVLPRALDVLFNSISGRQYEGMNLKPVLFTNVEKLTPEQEMVERRIKESVMKLSSDDDIDMISMLGDDASVSLINSTISSEGSNISSLNSRFSDQSRASTSSAMDGKESLGSSEHLFDLLGERVREEAKVNVGGQDQIQYSVWVSFAEIYNEQIFDLLVPVSNKKNARRPCLKLSEDQSGSPYIKGLKLIHVANADEAYKLLTIGQRNLQKACTKLNQNSSRSHCIFNIKVLQVVDAENPHVSRISMLSLCDLAGSERYGKTKASGARLREAGNINTSLLTLGRCIATLRYNQANKDHTKIVPFRESKLTRLFQNFFVGHGKAAMIVNINQCASMFDETHHVFKFSAVASQVIMQPKPVFIQPKMPVSAPIPRASISWAAPCTPSKVKPAVSEVCPLPGEDEDEDLEDDEDEVPQQLYTRKDIEELLLLIESLQAQLVEEQKSKDRLESEIRRELCDEMAEQFRLMEEHCSEQIRMREESVEEMYEKRLELVQNAERARRQNLETKKDDDDEWVSSVLLHQEQVKVQRRDEKITTLKDELSEIKDQLRVQNVAKEELQARNTEHETELAQLRSHTCTSTDTSEKDIHIQELEDKIKSLQETVDALKQTLAQKPEEKEEDNSQANLVENLTIQLQKAQDQIKEQSQEMSELNEMLTEAGETFTQKESEIQKLKDLTQEYEAKMLKQSDAIQALQQGIADSREALSSADKTMSNSEEKVSSLHQDLQQLTGTTPVEYVPETPVKAGNVSDDQAVSPQVKLLDESLPLFSYGNRKSFSTKKQGSVGRSCYTHGGDSSGVVADLDSDEDEIFFREDLIKPKHILKHSDSENSPGTVKDRNVMNLFPPLEGRACIVLLEKDVNTMSVKANKISESDVSSKHDSKEIPISKSEKDFKAVVTPKKDRFDFKSACKRSADGHFQSLKPLNDSRVLQIVLSPLKARPQVNHTKSSMLRLKNSPRTNRMKECQKNKNRRTNEDEDSIVIKRRKLENKEPKPVYKSRTNQKYNLRSRR